MSALRDVVFEISSKNLKGCPNTLDPVRVKIYKERVQVFIKKKCLL